MSDLRRFIQDGLLLGLDSEARYRLACLLRKAASPTAEIETLRRLPKGLVIAVLRRPAPRAWHEAEREILIACLRAAGLSWEGLGGLPEFFPLPPRGMEFWIVVGTYQELDAGTWRYAKTLRGKVVAGMGGPVFCPDSIPALPGVRIYAAILRRRPEGQIRWVADLPAKERGDQMVNEGMRLAEFLHQGVEFERSVGKVTTPKTDSEVSEGGEDVAQR